MYIQPLLLTALSGRPALSASFAGNTERAKADWAAGSRHAAESGPPTPLRPSRQGERISRNDAGDTLAISREAGSVLAREANGPLVEVGPTKGNAGSEGAWPGERSDGQEVRRDIDARLANDLDADVQRYVTKLAARDREVRAHEQAHLAAAGPFVSSGPSYEFTTGPDGRRYAIGGSVSIDVSPIADDPEATVRKAQVIRAAAMAPAQPSGQDRQVAAAAMKMETQARQELRQLREAGPRHETGRIRSQAKGALTRAIAGPGSLFNVYA